MKNKNVSTANINKTAALKEFYTSGGYQRLVGYAQHLVGGNLAEAEELVQESAYRTLKARSELRSGSKIGAWVCAGVKWVLGDWNRIKNRRYEVAVWRLGDKEIDLAEIVPDGQPTVLDQLVSMEIEAQASAAGCDEMTARAVAALKRLPPQYREALRLYDVERMTYREAAEQEGISIGAYEHRIARARIALKREFNKG